MLFSLVIATLNRDKDIKYCLDSIRNQIFKDFEVIIVDQSENNKTEEVVNSCGVQNIIYKKVSFKGLSRARNEALKYVNGQYICLIDDDAYYQNDYLRNANEHFHATGSKIILSGKMWNAIEKKEFVKYGKLSEGKALTYRELVRYCPSPALIIPRMLIEKIGGFDETFGVGAKYGAAEETDFVYRGKKEGFEVFFYSDLMVNHPHQYAAIRSNDLQKVYSYAYGTGAMFAKNFLITKHGKEYLEIRIPYSEKILKAFVKKILNRNGGKEELEGLLDGYRDYLDSLSV